MSEKKERTFVHSKGAQIKLKPHFLWWFGICATALWFTCVFAGMANSTEIRDFRTDYPPEWGVSHDAEWWTFPANTSLKFRLVISLKLEISLKLIWTGYFLAWRHVKNLGPIFLRRKKRLRQRTHKFRAFRNMGAIFLKKKKRLRQRSQPLRASKSLGPFFEKYVVQTETG